MGNYYSTPSTQTASPSSPSSTSSARIDGKIIGSTKKPYPEEPDPEDETARLTTRTSLTAKQNIRFTRIRPLAHGNFCTMPSGHNTRQVYILLSPDDDDDSDSTGQDSDSTGQDDDNDSTPTTTREEDKSTSTSTPTRQTSQQTSRTQTYPRGILKSSKIGHYAKQKEQHRVRHDIGQEVLPFYKDNTVDDLWKNNTLYWEETLGADFSQLDNDNDFPLPTSNDDKENNPCSSNASELVEQGSTGLHPYPSGRGGVGSLRGLNRAVTDPEALLNIGNSCYINAAVQLFFGSISPDVKHLDFRHDDRLRCSLDFYHVGTVCLLSTLIRQILQKDGSLGRPSGRRSLLAFRTALFQHPCLKTELDVARGISIESQFDSIFVLDAILESIYATDVNGKKLSEQLGFKPVGLVTRLTCCDCQRSHYTAPQFSHIHTVTLPSNTGKEEHFSSLLNLSLKESVPSACSSRRCRQKNKVHAQDSVFCDLGEKLVFHVSRLELDESGLAYRKNHQPIVLSGTLHLNSTDSSTLASSMPTTVVKSYFLTQVLLHLGTTDKNGHYVCIRFTEGAWFLFDDNKQRQYLGDTVDGLNETLRERNLLGAIHIVCYVSGETSNRFGGCAPVPRSQLGFKILSDESGTECLPDAIWYILKQLGYPTKLKEVRQGIHGDDNSLGYRSLKSAESYLKRYESLIVQKLPYDNEPHIFLGLTEGNYLLEFRYFLEHDKMEKAPPVTQRHFCAWLAGRGIIVDNTGNPTQVFKNEIHSKAYCKKLFKRLWPAAVRVEFLSTHFIGNADKIPGHVAQRMKEVKEMDRQRKRRKRRKHASKKRLKKGIE